MKISYAPVPPVAEEIPTVDSTVPGDVFEVLEGQHRGRVMLRVGDPRKNLKPNQGGPRVHVLNLATGELHRIYTHRPIKLVTAEVVISE